jgi:hypothetical protein
MIPPPSQLVLDFAMSGPRWADGVAQLRVYENEQECFASGSRSAPAFDVRIPRTVQETVLNEAGGWQRRPRPAGPAQSLGERMWASLPEMVRGRIVGAPAGTPLRVAVRSTGSGIDDVPWEWLNDGADRLVAAMDPVRFVRVLPTLYPAPPLTVPPPVRILLVLTNPKDERLLNPDRETAVVMGGLGPAGAYQLDRLFEPGPGALARALQKQPHVVHYVGHAGISRGGGSLILHDERDGTRWLPAAELARLLPTSVRLLCLSTCVTAENYQVGGLVRVANAASEVALPTTVVNQYALTEPGASAFWREFYPALLEHDGDVVEAFHAARMAARRVPLDTWDWASFSLVVRDGSGRPFRLAAGPARAATRGASPSPGPEARAAELQAQWAARLANSLAAQMPAEGTEARKIWEKALDDEGTRLDTLEREIGTDRP